MAVHSTLVGAAADIDSAAAEIDSAAAAGGEAVDIVGSDYYYYSCVPLMSSSTPNKWWDVYKMVK